MHTIFLFVYYSIFSTCFRKLYVQRNRRNMLSVVSQLVARNAFTARRRRTKDPSQFRAPGAESRLHAPDNVPSAFVAFTGTSSPRDLGLSSSSVCHFFDSVRESARFFLFWVPCNYERGRKRAAGATSRMQTVVRPGAWQPRQASQPVRVYGLLPGQAAASTKSPPCLLPSIVKRAAPRRRVDGPHPECPSLRRPRAPCNELPSRGER